MSENEERSKALNEMFGSDVVDQSLGVLAESICTMKDKIEKMEAEVTAKTEELIQKMLEAGTNVLATPNGLKPKIEQKISLTSKKEVDAALILAWLEEHDMGGIIKREPYVEPGTLKSTIEKWIEADDKNKVPDTLFNYYQYNGIRWNGKSSFLARMEGPVRIEIL